MRIGPRVDLTYQRQRTRQQSGRPSRHRGRQARRLRCAEERQASDADRGPRRARASRRRGDPGRRGPDRAQHRHDRPGGRRRLERLQRAAHRGRARRRARSRLPAAKGRPRHGRDSGGRHRAATSTSSICSAPTRSTRRNSAKRSSSIKARTATPARTAPMSSCRAPPTPNRTAPTSTPKAACSWPKRATFPPGDAREDWTILRALSDVLGKRLPYDDMARAAQSDASRRAAFRRRSTARPRTPAPIPRSGPTSAPPARSPRRRSQYPITDFYLTNPIARASHVMAECSTLFVKPRTAQAAE